MGSGGRSATGGTLGTGGILGQGGAIDAGVVADGGSTICGDKVCTATQLCIRPSCAGGTAVPCQPLIDAGTCPANYTYSTYCQYMAGVGGPGPGCLPPACVNPPPFCLDLPAACVGKTACSCLPYDACGTSGGMCMMISGSVVQCGAA